MRILTYKRIHIGDPDEKSRFGIHDCMGNVRAYEYDAVIGVGGIGAEPQSYGIDRKINWVGIHPTKARSQTNNGLMVTFKHFLLLEEKGPLLNDIAPHLAKRLFEGGARFIITGYSMEELSEANGILEWAKDYRQPKFVGLVVSKAKSGCKIKCKSVYTCWPR